MGGNAQPSVGSGAGFAHDLEGSSRARFENDLEQCSIDDSDADRSRELRPMADLTFFRPRESKGRADRFGEANSSNGSKFGCKFSAPVSENELEDCDEDIIEEIEEKSVEFDTDTERLKTGLAFEEEVVDSLPMEFALVNLLRPGIVGASGLKVGNNRFSISLSCPNSSSSWFGEDRQSRGSSILVDMNRALCELRGNAPVLPRRP